MHILIVTDQHPDSLGGAQVSIRLQRTALERAGHTVSIAAPRRLNRAGHSSDESRGLTIDLPAAPITPDREYGAAWPGAASRRIIRAALADAPPVDIVHVQGDFWGALLGHRIARDLSAPVVHTMHNNLDVGTRSVTSLAPALFEVMNVARRLTLGRAPIRKLKGESGAWAYLRNLAIASDAIIAPSSHFALELKRHTGLRSVHVIPTGVDDDMLDALTREPRPERAGVHFVWLGRMSPEKRPRELIEAFSLAHERGGLPASTTLTVVGSGSMRDDLESIVADRGAQASIRFTGALPYRDALAEIRAADALVQTSIGFETQGMTPTEAIALGTPVIFSDPNIFHETPAEPAWLAPGATVADLAATLENAATEIENARREGGARVSPEVAREFRQSHRVEQLTEVYEAVLRERQIS